MVTSVSTAFVSLPASTLTHDLRYDRHYFDFRFTTVNL